MASKVGPHVRRWRNKYAGNEETVMTVPHNNHTIADTGSCRHQPTLVIVAKTVQVEDSTGHSL